MSRTYSYAFSGGTTITVVTANTVGSVSNYPAGTAPQSGYFITSITGTYLGAAIGGLVGSGGVYASDPASGNVIRDNTLFASDSQGDDGAGGSASLDGIDGDGIEFSVGTDHINIFSDGIGFYAADTASGGSLTTLTLTSYTPPCYAQGTLIRTPTGQVAVELLQPGDLIMSAFGGAVAVSWIGHRHVDCARHPTPRDVWPVRVQAGAFGPGLPARDLLLSPDHAVYVDRVLIPVRHLLNGASIAQAPRPAITYWHVELPMHDVLLAEGLACESYLDTGNRAAFANAPGAVQMTPDFARRVWETQACAPLVTSGPELAAVRSTTAEIAKSLGFGFTRDPRLVLEVDGATVPLISANAAWSARLPKGSRTATLRSLSFVPLELDLACDRRCLGVAVSALWLDDEMVALDDSRLLSGWHDDEQTLRWTNGAATIALHGATRLQLGIEDLGRYRVADQRLKVA